MKQLETFWESQIVMRNQVRFFSLCRISKTLTSIYANSRSSISNRYSLDALTIPEVDKDFRNMKDSKAQRSICQ